MIIAVDFDGTLCTNKYPDIGQPKEAVIAYVKEKQRDKAKVILYTCRAGEKLNDAVTWCKKHGLDFDAVNTNIPEAIKRFGSDCRKIYADLYIDDKALSPKDIAKKQNGDMVNPYKTL